MSGNKIDVETTYTPEEPSIGNPAEREAVVSCSSDSCDGNSF